MSVVPFIPTRPYVELVSPGTLHSGEVFYWLEFCEPAEVGRTIVWDGTDYDEGLEAAGEWQAEGVHFINSVQTGRPH